MMWIPVVLLVGDHWVSGLIANDGRRLQEVLNDKASEFLTVSDARLYLSAEMTEPVASLPRVVMPKNNVVLVMLTEETHEAPRKRATSFVRKDAFECYLTVPSLEIKGFVHLLQRSDPAGFLLRLAKEGNTFFPVTMSSVSAVGPLAEASTAPVTLVNRVHVDLLYLAESPTIL